MPSDAGSGGQLGVEHQEYADESNRRVGPGSDGRPWWLLLPVAVAALWIGTKVLL